MLALINVTVVLVLIVIRCNTGAKYETAKRDYAWADRTISKTQQPQFPYALYRATSRDSWDALRSAGSGFFLGLIAFFFRREPWRLAVVAVVLSLVDFNR